VSVATGTARPWAGGWTDAPDLAPKRRTRWRYGPCFEVVPDVLGVQTAIANAFLVGDPSADEPGWVLVDTGCFGFGGRILRAIADRFGTRARPRAIILTHGHFDHVGGLRKLLARWDDVPVYAHELELPYLTGRAKYPPGDPTVVGGLLAWSAMLYPRGPIDLGGHVQPLPGDGTVPYLPGWRWIPTPGHSPGHVSLFRDTDRTLIAGDAFVTTRQECLLASLAHVKHLQGPPSYFTPDWASAWASVERLANLHPHAAVTGHGPPLYGAELDEGLQHLARDFDVLAVPPRGRYMGEPALSDKTGVVYLPPASPLMRSAPYVLIGAATVGVLGYLAWRRRRAEECD
jgi:glyoxylase-like metal-dependent hydrolase (beta-lactamase superfamily II)